MVASSGVFCSLCGLHTFTPLKGSDGKLFCCHACVEVAELLAEKPSQPEETAHPEMANAGMTMQLRGLWCSSCAWLIEQRLRLTPGVGSAQVSFLQLQASVAYDSAATSPEKIRKRVRQLGYQAYLDHETPKDEEEGFFTRMLVGGMLSMHIMTSSGLIYLRQVMGWDGPDTQWLVHFFQWMEFFLSIPLVLILGLPIFKSGLAGLMQKMPNIHTLVAIGTIAALALSTRNLLLNTGQVYFDTASMLLFLLTVGRWLEMQAYKSGFKAVEELTGQIPDQATVIENGGEKIIFACDITAGLRILVRPGERFPADGLVASGLGDIDESMLTGESRPVLRRPGEPVYAGTTNLDGTMEVIVSAAGAQTRAGQIGRLLHHALWQRSPVERLADRLAAMMVPFAAVLALGTFLFWNARLGMEAGLMNALAVLLIACPCALALATPLTLWAALAQAAKNGVILRSTAAVERLARVRHIFFDKTGTLTRLPLRLMAVSTFGETEDMLIQKVASVESLSDHPLAEALAGAARSRGLDISAPEGFRVLPGAGVRALVGGETVVVGRRQLMEKEGLSLPDELAQTAEQWQRTGWVVVFAGWAGQARGVLALGESMRAESAAALEELRQQGKTVSVLTGDSAAAGARWQQRLGIPVEAALSPEEKLERIQRVGPASAMVGDGINDGPALAAAGIGIALARGTQVARSAAEVVLVRDDLRLVAWLTALSKEARRRLHQNLVWAFAYNLIGLTLAVGGQLQPVIGAAAMVISSLLVTQNALRLRKFPPLQEKQTDFPDEFEPRYPLEMERTPGS
jgi:heavy metal translocating P-type ATPase